MLTMIFLLSSEGRSVCPSVSNYCNCATATCQDREQDFVTILHLTPLPLKRSADSV